MLFFTGNYGKKGEIEKNRTKSEPIDPIDVRPVVSLGRAAIDRLIELTIRSLEAAACVQR